MPKHTHLDAVTGEKDGFHAPDGAVERADESHRQDRRNVGQPGDGLEGNGRGVQNDAHVQGHLVGLSIFLLTII